MVYFRSFVDVVNAFFFVYMMLYAVFLFVSVIIAAMVIEERARRIFFYDRNSLKSELNYVPLSVLIPAYNEALVIVDNVKSLLRSDYHAFEIIVIDDGSSDGTCEAMIEAFDLQKIDRPLHNILPTKPAIAIYESVDTEIPIVLVQKENGGKADSLNMGINVSSYPYFLGLDADSVVQEDTLRNLMESVIRNKHVVACGGMVQIANEAVIVDGKIQEHKFPKNLLVRFQLLEYSRTFLGSRLFLDTFNGNMIISGACGLFKKDLVVQLGGYDTNIIGEDMELSVRLHAYCQANHIKYRMVYNPNAICWTQVPENLEQLHKQRRRWHLGLIQSLLKYKNVLFNVKYGLMGCVSMVYYLIFEALSPFIEFIGLIFIITAGLLGSLNFSFWISYYLLFLAFSILVTITSFLSRMYVFSAKISAWQGFSIIIFSFLECLIFRPFVTLCRMSAFVNYKKNKQVWGDMKRKEHNHQMTSI